CICSGLRVVCVFCVFFFFFQAEDGIRDYKVTGVQTCALPIWRRARSSEPWTRQARPTFRTSHPAPPSFGYVAAAARAVCTRRARSEERRVGKECRCRWGP